jgi:hypothetical protein
MQTKNQFRFLVFLSLTIFLLVSVNRIILSKKSISKKAIATQKYNFELNDLTIEATVISASMAFFPIFYLLFNHFLSVLIPFYRSDSKISYKNKFFFILFTRIAQPNAP